MTKTTTTYNMDNLSKIKTQNLQNKRKRYAINIHHIVIEKDGWVWVSTNNGHEMGLGDIGVDVEIVDKRK